VVAAHETRRQLGQIMVEEGFISSEQLAYALGEQARLGRPLGKLLVELGFVSEGAVANALAEQHGGLLKTEFGISAGLHPHAVDAAPAAPLEQEHERVVRLEARLAEAAQAHAEDVAHVQAAASARIAELEAQLRAAVATREELAIATRLGAARIKELGAEVASLRAAAEERQAEETAAAEAAAEHAHLLFVPSASGYALIEWPGPSPASGALLDVDGSSFLVRRVGASPLPGRRLRCAFLERA
jgi:hypothetical protein